MTYDISFFVLNKMWAQWWTHWISKSSLMEDSKTTKHCLNLSNNWHFKNNLSSHQVSCTHRWVSLSTDKHLNTTILQSDGANAAALTVGHKHAAPRLLGGQSQTWGLSKASLVGVRIVPVFLTAAAGPSHASPGLEFTVVCCKIITWQRKKPKNKSMTMF